MHGPKNKNVLPYYNILVKVKALSSPQKRPRSPQRVVKV